MRKGVGSWDKRHIQLTRQRQEHHIFCMLRLVTQAEPASAMLCKNRDGKTSICNTPATERTGLRQEIHKVSDPAHTIPPPELISKLANVD